MKAQGKIRFRAKFASSPSLFDAKLGILSCIRKFYCGEDKTLVPLESHADAWSVHAISAEVFGKPIPSVAVVRRRGRYVFGALEKELVP